MAETQHEKHETDAVSEEPYYAAGGDLDRRRKGRTSSEGESEVHGACK